MAIFEDHKYEKRYLERMNNPRTSRKPITPHMNRQKRTSEPQPDTSYLKSKALNSKIGKKNANSYKGSEIDG